MEAAAVLTPAALSAPVVPATVLPAATGPAGGRAALIVTAGPGRGRRLGSIAFALARGRVRAAGGRVRLPRGRYRAALCASAAPRCAFRRLIAGARRTLLPALSVAVPSGARVRARYTVTGVGGRFLARTAGRPSQGVLLGG